MLKNDWNALYRKLWTTRFVDYRIFVTIRLPHPLSFSIVLEFPTNLGFDKQGSVSRRRCSKALITFPSVTASRRVRLGEFTGTNFCYRSGMSQLVGWLSLREGQTDEGKSVWEVTCTKPFFLQRILWSRRHWIHVQLLFSIRSKTNYILYRWPSSSMAAVLFAFLKRLKSKTLEFILGASLDGIEFLLSKNMYK